MSLTSPSSIMSNLWYLTNGSSAMTLRLHTSQKKMCSELMPTCYYTNEFLLRKGTHLVEEVVFVIILNIKLKMFLKSGQLYKLGEGPINYDWNLRYFVLDCNHCCLLYKLLI